MEFSRLLITKYLINMATDDPFFQLANARKNPEQTGNAENPTEGSIANGENEDASATSHNANPFETQKQTTDHHTQTQNHPIDEDSLNFFASASSAPADKGGLHEDEHEHDDLITETQNEHAKNIEDDPLSKLQSAGGATGGDSSKSSFLNFTPTTNTTAQTTSTSSTNPSANTGLGNQTGTGFGNQTGTGLGNQTGTGFGNQTGMGYPSSNLGNPLGQDARQYTANRYLSHQQNLANSQGFMGQFQQNVNTLQGNNGGNGGWDLPINMLVGDISYMEALSKKLFFKKDRKKANEEELKEVVKKLEKLKDKIKTDNKNYRRWELVSKRWAFIFKFLSSALAAVVTVLLGINITDTLRSWSLDWWINFFALLISAFISLIGVFQQFFDSDKLWVKYTDTANKLQQLLSIIEYIELSKEYLSLDDVDAINVEYFRIIESTHDYELLIRAKNDETSNQITHQGIIHQNGASTNQGMGMNRGYDTNQGMGMNRGYGTNQGMGMNQGMGTNPMQGGYNSPYNAQRRY